VGSKSAGYENGGCDWLANPYTISHYDLFPRTLNPSGQSVAWKGCVEARPSKAEQTWLNGNWGGSYKATTDYDVTDTAPSSSDNLSLFVPYFWPDEPDYNMVSVGLSGARTLCERVRRLPQQLHRRRHIHYRQHDRGRFPQAGDGR